MKYVLTLAALLLFTTSYAQNPPGTNVTPTTSGGIIDIAPCCPAGVPPFTLWQWDGISTWMNRAVSTAGEDIVVDWHAPGQSISYRLTGNGVTPNNGITVTVIASPLPVIDFCDVDETYWAYSFIQWAANEGLMVGTGSTCEGSTDPTWHPNREITRAEIAVIMKRLHDLNH